MVNEPSNISVSEIRNFGDSLASITIWVKRIWRLESKSARCGQKQEAFLVTISCLLHIIVPQKVEQVFASSAIFQMCKGRWQQKKKKNNAQRVKKSRTKDLGHKLDCVVGFALISSRWPAAAVGWPFFLVFVEFSMLISCNRNGRHAFLTA